MPIFSVPVDGFNLIPFNHCEYAPKLMHRVVHPMKFYFSYSKE